MQTYQLKTSHSWFKPTDYFKITAVDNKIKDITFHVDEGVKEIFIAKNGYIISVDDAVSYLYHMFNVCSSYIEPDISPEDLYKQVQFSITDQNGNLVDPRDFSKMIYDTPLQSEIVLTTVTPCGCNMGYCNAPVSVDFEVCKLFRDVIPEFMHDIAGYPDSVCYSFRKENPPSYVYSNSCRGEQQLVTYPELTKIYYTAGYFR